MKKIVETQINGKTFSIESGKLAKQAAGSVVVQYGETVVLVTATAAHSPKDGMSFLPLSVEYQEKLYSIGRIPGNYFRREIGRPGDKETLTARLIDRPLRPLFPKGYAFETQIIATVLSMDKENDSDVLAIVGASTALEISDIPFQGPIAAVRVARKNEKLIVNPTIQDCEDCDFNIVVAGSKTGIIMVEGEADIVSEAEMLEAIFFAHDAMQPLIELQIQLKEAIGKEKRIIEVKEEDQELVDLITSKVAGEIKDSVLIKDKMERHAALRNIKKKLVNELGIDYEARTGEISEIFQNLLKQISRDIILKDKTRIDGRKFDEIRDITCDVGVLPRPHGSAVFTRGETQVLSVLTLGSSQDEQRFESLMGEERSNFMLHYNFPPYSVGECRRPGGPSRRDIGHGTLARKSIAKVLPDKENFDYTIRLVSEVLESNGSSSMGTVCSGILALMDGGVPIKTPVSGIAMGLVQDENTTVILSDILGDEDHTGDMDFKVTGTKDGITALQMDIKIKELSMEIMEKALEQARVGRLHILNEMINTLDVSRKEMSPYAPKVFSIKINPDKIRDIIGPGGKMIRQIQADTNTRVEVDDTGIVKVAALSSEDADAARKIITDIGTDPEVGTIYNGIVAKITDFGAFVTIKTGTDGLVHISELADYRVKKVTDIVKEGDTIKVKVLEVTRDGKIRLSHKATFKKTKS